MRCWPEDGEDAEVGKETAACRELAWVAGLLALAYVVGIVLVGVCA